MGWGIADAVLMCRTVPLVYISIGIADMRHGFLLNAGGRRDGSAGRNLDVMVYRFSAGCR